MRSDWSYEDATAKRAMEACADVDREAFGALHDLLGGTDVALPGTDLRRRPQLVALCDRTREVIGQNVQRRAIGVIVRAMARSGDIRRQFLLILVAFFAAFGCASQTQLLQKTSATRIGCEPEAVAISDVHREGTRPRTWTVTCQERMWVCSNDWGRVTCAPVASTETRRSLD
jgi:hypothetical protein